MLINGLIKASNSHIYNAFMISSVLPFEGIYWNKSLPFQGFIHKLFHYLFIHSFISGKWMIEWIDNEIMRKKVSLFIHLLNTHSNKKDAKFRQFTLSLWRPVPLPVSGVPSPCPCPVLSPSPCLCPVLSPSPCLCPVVSDKLLILTVPANQV